MKGVFGFIVLLSMSFCLLEGHMLADNEIKQILKRLSKLEEDQTSLKNLVYKQAKRIAELEGQLVTKTNFDYDDKPNPSLESKVKKSRTIPAGNTNFNSSLLNGNGESRIYHKDYKNKAEIEDEANPRNPRKKLLMGDGNLNHFVGFSSILSGHLNHLTTDHIIPFKTIDFNDGNGYNGSDGIFIVPKPGVYFFAWNIMIQGGWEAYVKLVVNGNAIRWTAVNTNNGYADASNFALKRLNAGDHVWLAIYARDCDLFAPQSSFTGFLVSH